jgi:hypothetical protein
MRKHLSSGLTTAFFSVLIVSGSIAQTAEVGRARSLIESDEPSGWARLELAVYIDSDNATLSTEVWDAFPVLNYSDERRWLTSYDEINALKDTWGEAAVQVNNNGSIQVFPEPPKAPEVSATDVDLSDSRPAAASEDRETADPLLALPFDESATHSALGVVEGDSGVLVNATRKEEAALQNNAVQVPLEALSMASKSSDEAASSAEQESLAFDQAIQSNAADEVLLDLTTGERGAQPMDLLGSAEFTAGTDLPGDLDGVNSDSRTLNWLDTYADDNPVEPPSLVDVEAPLALPATYQRLPIEMLAQGIERLRKTSEKSPVVSLAWLQAPEGVAAPIVLDTWLENEWHPRLQGTVKISVDTEAILEMDLWMNSRGEDLPTKYTPMVPRPQAPQRVLVVEHSTDAGNVQEASSVEYIDVNTGLNSTTNDNLRNSLAPQPSAVLGDPQYRHAIALRETRSLRQGYVRYVDHPAIQVVATWRELSFKEVYELGEAQRIRRDIDSLTRTLTTPDNAFSNSSAP